MLGIRQIIILFGPLGQTVQQFENNTQIILSTTSCNFLSKIKITAKKTLMIRLLQLWTRRTPSFRRAEDTQGCEGPHLVSTAQKPRRAHLIIHGGDLIVFSRGFSAMPYLQSFQKEPLRQTTVMTWFAVEELVLYLAVAWRFRERWGYEVR